MTPADPPTRTPPAGLLLAAGGGSRMGGPKALLQVEGESLVARAVRTLESAGCDPVVVVLGAQAGDVAVPRGARVIVNPAWASGIASSLRVGLGALAESDAGSCVVLLVDMPGVGPDAVRLVATDAGPATLATARYGGVPGHPVVLGRSHWAGVAAAATGDVGARPYLEAHRDLVRAVSCDGVADPGDLDTPADLDASVGWRHAR